MPIDGWLWLALDVLLIVLVVRQYRLAMRELASFPERWSVFISKNEGSEGSTESDHVPEQHVP